MTGLRRWLAGALALAAMEAAQAAPDALHGEQVYARCLACWDGAQAACQDSPTPRP